MQIGSAIKKVNVVSIALDHAVGRGKHSLLHRLLVGSALMVLGVLLDQWAHHVAEFAALHVVGSAVGSAIHGIGLIPFCEACVEKFNA